MQDDLMQHKTLQQLRIENLHMTAKDFIRYNHLKYYDKTMPEFALLIRIKRWLFCFSTNSNQFLAICFVLSASLPSL